MSISNRTLSLDIYMNENGDAEVVLFDGETSDSTSMTYNLASAEDGSFKEWLTGNVIDWIMFMQEEMADNH